LANSREKTVGSELSCVQLIVTEPPEVGSLEDTSKFDIAEAKERKKRKLVRKSEKEDWVCKERERMST
jgi:hypothetical protein